MAFPMGMITACSRLFKQLFPLFIFFVEECTMMHNIIRGSGRSHCSKKRGMGNFASSVTKRAREGLFIQSLPLFLIIADTDPFFLCIAED